MITSLKSILSGAYAGHYAVGAFNCLSLENVIGAIEAAEELHSPIILQLAEVQFPYAPPEKMVPIFLEAAEAASVPVCVHLDHSQSLDTCIRGLKLGFNSVMFDGASLPFENNIRETVQVVRIARCWGADVEAELGQVGDTGVDGTGEGCTPAARENSPKDPFTDPDDAVRFIADTGVDALAIAIGNMHGRYIATPRLNIERTKKINTRCRIPLVLHGGSGTSEEDFRACIHNGVSKINVATALQIAATKRVSTYFLSTSAPSYIGIKNEIVRATKESVAEHIRLFGSQEKV